MKHLLLLPLLLCLFPSLYAQEPELQHHKTDTPMLHRYTQYNEWANTQMTEWLAQASEEQFSQEIESSFSTLKATLIHIWNAEYLWLQVLKSEPIGAMPSASFEGSKAELLQAVLETSERFQAYVGGLDAAGLAASVPSGSSTLAVADIIQHCMNHSTYHRGQLITMGRQAGLQSPPRTDFIHFVRLQN
jgi:uncharacterized damage-inducible protein DinB